MEELNTKPEKLLNFISKSRLPVIVQTEVSECGLVCLAMISGYYGFETDIVSLRRRFSISNRGTTLNALIGIASSMNLSSRALKVESHQLHHLQLPCIIHWDLNHFVVLKTVGKATVVIHDPAIGERHLKKEEFNKSFTGVALELSANSDFKEGTDKVTLNINHFWTKIVGLKRSLLNLFALSMLLQLFTIATPLYMQIVVDDVIVRNDESLLTALAIGFALLLVIQIGTSSVREYLVIRISSLLNMQMAANLFRHLIRLPMLYFSKRHIGDIVSRFGSLEQIRQLLAVGLVSAFVDGLLAIITLIAMLIYSVKLTIIVLVVVVLYAFIRFILYQPLRLLNEESIIAQAKQESNFLETIRAIQTIKLFQTENDRQNQWQNKLADSLNKEIGLAHWAIRYNIIYGMLFGLESLVIIYLGAILVMDGMFSVGMLFAFMSFKGRFVAAMDALIRQWIDLKMLGLHLNRLADIAHTPQEDIYSQINSNISLPSEEKSSIIEIMGTIEVRNLAYRFSESDPFIFENMNFTIDAGETVVLVGPSGCGKTTLLKCLMGLITPTNGEILVDGRPLSSLYEYRSHIAGIMQDDCLLTGSISDNISFFSKNINFEKVVECAKLAFVHDEIESLTMQYNTLVGDMGSSLSGGQRQRIMIARALYQSPKILFMDEATSHLDVENERVISRNIKALSMTRVLVAHRPETIKNVDRVIKMNS